MSSVPSNVAAHATATSAPDHPVWFHRVDVAEVFPGGCHQLDRGRGSVDAVERPQFGVVEGTRAPLLRRSGGGGGMATRSWSSAAPAGEGCREVVPGSPPGMYSVEGSCCWGTEQGVAAGSKPGDSWGPGVPVISVMALGPLASCPGCRNVPSVAWRPPGCGGGCPPAPCVGLGLAAGSLGCVSLAPGPPDSGWAADPGRDAADELDTSPAAWWGSA